MLLTVALPLVYEWLVAILKTKQKVLTISVERVSTFPWLVTESSEDPAILILDDDDRCFPLPAILVESNKTAPILVKVEYSFPFTLSVKIRKTSNEV